jgi:SAM-dependent methyltransferase
MKGFFRRAYESGEYGWPSKEPTAQVLEFFEEALARHPKGAVLDIGCGEGRHAIAFADGARSVVAMDYEPLAVEKARARAAGFRPGRGLRWLVADAFSMPFWPEVFSVAVDYGVFHHIKLPDQARYIEEVRRVLVPGGCFLLSVFSTRFQHCPGEVRSRNWVVHRDHYDRFFTREELVGLFGRAFSVEAVVEEVSGHEAFHHALMVKEAA